MVALAVLPLVRFQTPTYSSAWRFEAVARERRRNALRNFTERQ
jgi:hypothetical protein